MMNVISDLPPSGQFYQMQTGNRCAAVGGFSPSAVLAASLSCCFPMYVTENNKVHVRTTVEVSEWVILHHSAACSAYLCQRQRNNSNCFAIVVPSERAVITCNGFLFDQ